MKIIWKWIIGVVVSLLIIAALISVVYMVRSHMLVRPEINGWTRPVQGMPGPGMMSSTEIEGCNQAFPLHRPGMMRIRFFPIGSLMWILPLGLITLVVLGIVRLFKGPNKSTLASIPASVLTCKNCGQTVHSDWRNCPHCGKKQ